MNSEPYPYYILPAIQEYRELDPKSERARILSRKIAANIGDYAALRLILGIDPPEFARFYPDMLPDTPDTFDTIDEFLGKYNKDRADSTAPAPTAVPYNIEMELWDSPVLTSVDDSIPYLPEEKPLPSEQKNYPQPQDENLSQPEKKTEDHEGNRLAQLLKAGNIDEAIALIEQQNLNNPQKSIYFAHQMRFLKKLKAINNFKNKQNG